MNGDWNDEHLIKALEKGSSDCKSTKEKTVKRETSKPKAEASNNIKANNAPKNSKSSTRKTMRKFNKGDPCRAIYIEDGHEYEATVQKLNSDGTCLIKFVGYGNVQKVKTRDLRESQGPKAVSKQIQACGFNSSDDPRMKELNELIESWYLRGYYQGYSAALRHQGAL